MNRLRKEVTPLKGNIEPIRTMQETRPNETFGEAYVMEIDQRSAFQVKKLLQKSFPPNPDQSCNHLRRFVTYQHLPEYLREHIKANGYQSDGPAEHTATIYVLISPPLPDITELQTLLAPFAPVKSSGVKDGNKDKEGGVEEFEQTEAVHLTIFNVRVPLFPALTASQASAWTRTSWPVAFNPAAPRSFIAPPPAILKQAAKSIQPNAGFYISLAQKVAEEARLTGRGRPVGAVIVDPTLDTRIDGSSDASGYRQSEDWTRSVVAVAGDARYCTPGADLQSNENREDKSAQGEKDQSAGGPEFHAVMRSISIVADQRLRGDDDTVQDKGHLPPLSKLESAVLNCMDEPSSQAASALDAQRSWSPSLSKPQKTSHRIRSRSQGGYLCTDLDIYLSHEPCLSCCMGILLSRFRAVIFPRNGRMTSGGLASEPVLDPSSRPRQRRAEKLNAGEDSHHNYEQLERHAIFDDDNDDNDGGDDNNDDKRKEKEERPYYGLHWRKELNWRVLGFEFIEQNDEDTINGNDNNPNTRGGGIYVSSSGMYYA